jgi:hypothetical protein
MTPQYIKHNKDYQEHEAIQTLTILDDDWNEREAVLLQSRNGWQLIFRD